MILCHELHEFFLCCFTSSNSCNSWLVFPCTLCKYLARKALQPPFSPDIRGTQRGGCAQPFSDRCPGTDH